ncbi:MAG: hypothetical protein KGZ59_03685 [Chitinophagaceae bacterium]|nr:hypothetical protein [Chitinophagaceae bacterium]
MKNYNKQFILILTLLIAIILPTLCIAQGDPGGDPGVPFDGGASILIAAGAAYGVKKYREKHLKK